MNKLTKPTTSVTDLYLNQEFKFFRGQYNILDCGIRTGKTYWAIHHLIDFTRDKESRRILFLTDTTALKESLVESYPDECCEADMLWEHADSEWSAEIGHNKIGVMCYQALGMRVMKEDTDFLKSIDVICWDECDSIFDFAASAFARARKYDFARKDSTNGEILNVIQQHSSNKEYMPLVLLGFWEKLINERRILCVGLSATPERARMYYNSLVGMSYNGKIETAYRAATDIYYKNVYDHIRNLKPIPGIGYWVYSPSIKVNKSIVAAAIAQGFHAIEIHSLNNEDNPMTTEQLRVVECIEKMHMVPYEYDFVVVTKAFQRGIDIVDPRFRNLIVDSYYHTDRVQAARQTFPYQRHVKVLSQKIPEDYLNRWFPVEEGRQLAEYLAIPSTDKYNNAMLQNTPMTWNKLVSILPAFGYTVEKKNKRLNGEKSTTVCYRITGEWQDVEVQSDGDFMQLVAAKSESQIEQEEGLI